MIKKASDIKTTEERIAEATEDGVTEHIYTAHDGIPVFQTPCSVEGCTNKIEWHRGTTVSLSNITGEVCCGCEFKK